MAWMKPIVSERVKGFKRRGLSEADAVRRAVAPGLAAEGVGGTAVTPLPTMRPAPDLSGGARIQPVPVPGGGGAGPLIPSEGGARIQPVPGSGAVGPMIPDEGRGVDPGFRIPPPRMPGERMGGAPPPKIGGVPPPVAGGGAPVAGLPADQPPMEQLLMQRQLRGVL
jgi:hypothetical protein